MARTPSIRLITALTAAAALAACSSGPEREPAPVRFQGTQPSGASARPSAPAAPLTNAGPDARGVVFNDGYETIIAREGDTVDSLAARVDITGAELAAYNGLPTTYRPQRGDELVLPAKPGGYRGGSAVAAASPALAPSSPALAPTSTVPAPAPIPATPIGQSPASAPAATAATTPAANGSTWSASSIAAAIGTGPGATTDAAQPAAAEAVSPAPSVAPQPAPEPAPTPAQTAAVAPATPAPAAPAPTAAQPASVASTAPAAASTRFVRPVDAPISRQFSKLPGPNRNDGVDFASPAGMDVRAAEAGTVALVSKSLGGLGTIVLIRHEGGLLTVYGRVDNVTLTKGDAVARGQSFAKVADLPSPREPSLHFEVRRGAESVDPAGFI